MRKNEEALEVIRALSAGIKVCNSLYFKEEKREEKDLIQLQIMAMQSKHAVKAFFDEQGIRYDKKQKKWIRPGDAKCNTVEFKEIQRLLKNSISLPKKYKKELNKCLR